MRGVIESASNERRGDRVEAAASWARRQSDEFDSADVAEAFAITRVNANQVLHRLWSQGLVVRVRTGFYQARSSK